MKLRVEDKSNQKNTPEMKGETWKERHSGMNFSMILYIGWKNLKVSKTRSVLTIGGVALGIGIITFLLCMGFGVQKMIVNEVTKNNPVNVVEVNNGNLDNFVSLSDDYVGKIKSIEGVSEVNRQVNTGGKIILGESQMDVVIFGTTLEYLELSRVNMRFRDEKFSNGGGKAIVSDRLTSLLGFSDPMEAVGKTLNYSIAISKEVSSGAAQEKVQEGNEIEVVGIVSGTDSAFMYVPFEKLHSDFGIDLAQNGKIVIGNMEKFDSAKQQIEQMGFVTESINDLIVDINSFFNTIRGILVIFGVIVMSISVMGMLNTLSVSLLQRTKEIGILKALGTKRRDVFKMFIVESIIISFVGGVFGFLGGFGFASAINELLIYLGKRMGVELTFFVFVPSYFVMAIGGFIVFLGFFTGLMPAFRAAKIHALEALRYE